MTFEEEMKVIKHRHHLKGKPLRIVLSYCKGFQFEQGCLYTILDKIVDEIEKLKWQTEHDKEFHNHRNTKESRRP